ncbi:hypothetical protein EPUS_01335 [Endocarpon pusillum Z07020]|uniref:DUF6594 domain-containing protein n=1 Tax=Endocarpon pusillum (strain Z07020 / HMAS-L-300199) TaxID=1263415 RepID=U1I1Z4_ENDPU|nr:uncharacterized protein EPUS_01335 [Endocarpon pusillum Z07020]ERF75969.1 hypothetical protein EPUS_01335 [Endocarpon pusillum Z07020]
MEAGSMAESSTVDEVKIDMPMDPRPPEGYDRLASFMGYFPETAIFRRFATLNAKNILYLQAELFWLEEELEKVVKDDAQCTNGNRPLYSRDWYRLSHSEEHSDSNSKQWKIFMNIRKALKEYNTAILQQKELVKLDAPSSLALSAIKDWMESPRMGWVYLLGPDKDLWRKADVYELLALKRKEHDDLLSLWMIKFVRAWLHPMIGRHFKRDKSAQFMERSILTQDAILRITSVIALALSSILPLCSILILNTVHKVSVRLGIVAVFTVLFSLSLGLVTGARRVEIFAAAAAYAAVQVVFIAGDGQSSDINVPGKQP